MTFSRMSASGAERAALLGASTSDAMFDETRSSDASASGSARRTSKRDGFITVRGFVGVISLIAVAVAVALGCIREGERHAQIRRFAELGAKSPSVGQESIPEDGTDGNDPDATTGKQLHHLKVKPVGHTIWLGSELPNVKRAFLNQNKQILHKVGWKIKLWRSADITAENFPYTYHTIKRALKYNLKSHQNVFSMIGDLMKFEILYHHGGLYMDTNIELLRDPTDLFSVTATLGKEVFLVADPGGDKRFASAGFMGALEKHSALFASLITNKEYLDAIPFDEHCIANAWTGPMYLTLKLLHFDNAVILDRDTAYPLLCGQDERDMCLEQVDHEVLVGDRVSKRGSKLVVDKNDPEKIWRIKVPCKEVKKLYPDATALDHFTLGKSWTGCDPEAKTRRLVDWTLNYVHDPSSFIFDFVLDQVRWSEADNVDTMTEKLVNRRMSLLGTDDVSAQLVILANTARSGAQLMSELLRQAFDADEDTVVWEDGSGFHSDIPLYNRFLDIGDLWSERALEMDWVTQDMKPRILQLGVDEDVFNNLVNHPRTFLDQLLLGAARHGYRYVMTRIGWNNAIGGARATRRIARTILDEFPKASVFFLERANILAQYASLKAAEDTGVWMKYADPLKPESKDQPLPTPVAFDFEKFKQTFQERHDWIEFFMNEMRARRRQYVHLVYEEHLATAPRQVQTLKRIKEAYGWDIDVNPTYLRNSLHLVPTQEVELRERFENPESIPQLLTQAFPLDELV